MASKRTGTIEPNGKTADGKPRYRARILLKDGFRPRIPVPDGFSEARAREFAAKMQELEDERGELLAKRARKARVPFAAETVEQWSDRWLVAREEAGLSTVSDDRTRLSKHILPVVGSLLITGVSKDDVERVVETLDAKVRAGTLAWKTAIHVWSLVTRMFADCCASKRRELRSRTDNPAEGVRGPDRGDSKAKAYLYPSEFEALMASEAVPVEWRRTFAITTYLYCRAGEVNALTWDDVDETHGAVHIHRSVDAVTGKLKTTKSGETRRVPIEPTLAPLLAAMRAEAGGVGRVLATDATDRKLSRQLQRCLKLAGITRADLFANDATRKALTFHDLRATGITWAAVRGDDPLRIMQRAGHAAFATTQIYIRTAENLRDNFGSVFPNLPSSLLQSTSESTLEESEPKDDTSHRVMWPSQDVCIPQFTEIKRDIGSSCGEQSNVPNCAAAREWTGIVVHRSARLGRLSRAWFLRQGTTVSAGAP